MPGFKVHRGKAFKVPSNTVIIAPKAKRQPIKTEKQVRNIAKSEVNRGKETHQKIYQLVRTQYNNTTSVSGDLARVLTSIYQAGQENNPPSTDEQANDISSREGSKVHLQSITIRGLITIPGADSFTDSDRACIACRLVCFTCDKFPTYDSLQNEWAAGDNVKQHFLKDGADTLEFNGALARLWMPINKELFTVHADKRFILNRGQVITATAGSEGIGATTMHTVYKNINLNIKCKNKLLKYAEPTHYYPTNFGPSVYLMFAYTNGAPGSAAAVPFMQYNSTAKWKDE